MAGTQDTSLNRHPIVPVALALIVGIALDHWMPLPLTVWLLAAGVAALGWGIASGVNAARVAAALLLIWMVLFGGARHHVFWSTAAPNDVSVFADEEPRLVRLSGIIADQPEISSPPGASTRSPWARSDSTTATLACRQITAAGENFEVSGRAELRITGHMLHAQEGDEVEVNGWLARPRHARNPGGFDLADYFRRQGIAALVSADHPDAVTRVHAGSSISVWRWAAHLRAEGEALFARDLSPRTAPVAAALLFGSRSQMDPEIRDAFKQSGMLHVLAISGVHVAILAILLWWLARLLGLSVRATCVLTIGGVIGYTLLTDCRPPVVRATIAVCLYATTRFWLRRPMPYNSLALGAIGILLWNPTDLFDVGTQLSFLGVLAVICAASWIRQSRQREADSVWPIPAEDHSTIRAGAQFLWRGAKDGWRISLAAALFTMPLVAARFHIVSPVGVLLNVVLGPLSTLVLWAGYLHVAVGLLVPWASWVLAAPFDLGLSLFIGVVEAAAGVRLSHASVTGPPEWWLIGYYVLLGAIAFVRPVRQSGCRGWSMLAAWTILGLVHGLMSSVPQGLRCTFLSVGHGGAILVETPGGRTLLYDAGAIQDGQIAQRAVQSALWDQRQWELDAIIVSHADIDHFNGVAGLMEAVPVGGLFVSQQFLDFEQPAVASLCESSATQGVPIRLIRDGDQLRLEKGVSIEVLHPHPGRPHFDDNANSVVLLIEFAGRRILLTGDLEGAGQAALLRTPPRDVDVLLAPHHGSRKANPKALADWARPQHVVVSAGPRVDFKSLRAAYGDAAEIVSTHEAGAVTFEIRPGGTLLRSTVRPDRTGRGVSFQRPKTEVTPIGRTARLGQTNSESPTLRIAWFFEALAKIGGPNRVPRPSKIGGGDRSKFVSTRSDEVDISRRPLLSGRREPHPVGRHHISLSKPKSR